MHFLFIWLFLISVVKILIWQTFFPLPILLTIQLMNILNSRFHLFLVYF